MVGPITHKLQRFGSLDSDDVAALSAVRHQTWIHGPHSELVKVGSKPKHILAISGGWAIRYNIIRGGGRQITDFLLPGDICHLNSFSAAPIDDGIASLSSVKAISIEHADVEALMIARPRVANAAIASQLMDEARLRALVVNIGKRGATHRLGYMICDLWQRACAAKLVHGVKLHFPPTQADVADHIGLSTVHVNRTMQGLRAANLVDLRDRFLTVPDFEGLARASGYNAASNVAGVSRS